LWKNFITSVLYQYEIPYTLTKYHTCPIKSDIFKEDLKRFEKIWKIVRKLRNARLGLVPTACEAI